MSKSHSQEQVLAESRITMAADLFGPGEDDLGGDLESVFRGFVMRSLEQLPGDGRWFLQSPWDFVIDAALGDLCVLPVKLYDSGRDHGAETLTNLRRGATAGLCVGPGFGRHAGSIKDLLHELDCTEDGVSFQTVEQTLRLIQNFALYASTVGHTWASPLPRTGQMKSEPVAPGNLIDSPVRIDFRRSLLYRPTFADEGRPWDPLFEGLFVFRIGDDEASEAAAAPPTAGAVEPANVNAGGETREHEFKQEKLRQFVLNEYVKENRLTESQAYVARAADERLTLNSPIKSIEQMLRNIMKDEKILPK